MTKTYTAAEAEHETFQDRVEPWMLECFGPEISADITERNHRFLEEALELVQSTGCTRHEATQLVDYVYDRQVGDPPQEVGGVMVTLAALCLAAEIDMHECGEKELARVWTKIEKIRAKQAAKPKHSPLPQEVEQTYTAAEAETLASAAVAAALQGAAKRVHIPDDVKEDGETQAVVYWSRRAILAMIPQPGTTALNALLVTVISDLITEIAGIEVVDGSSAAKLGALAMKDVVLEKLEALIPADAI